MVTAILIVIADELEVLSNFSSWICSDLYNLSIFNPRLN